MINTLSPIAYILPPSRNPRVLTLSEFPLLILVQRVEQLAEAWFLARLVEEVHQVGLCFVVALAGCVGGIFG